MRVETLYSDSSGSYRVRADIRENNRLVHIIDIVDDDYGGEADWDDFTEEEQGNIQNLLLEEYDALATEHSEPDGNLEDDEEEDMAEKVDSPADTEKADAPSVVSEEDVKDETAKMISEISESLTSALSTLAETVKALDAKIEGINKSVAGVASKVEEVEDKFGKRVDAVEKDTAFRKSADLGEILQEEPVIVEKSTWGGRFLTNADLF